MYKLAMPQSVVFGINAMEKLDSLIPAGARVLTVSGASARKNGTLERIKSLLNKHEIAFYDQVLAEPTIQQLDEVRNVLRDFNGNAVLAVGGGSALDIGKVAAAAAGSELAAAEFFFNRAAMPSKGCFMAALPTTAGTGAEVTPNGVFTDKESNIKQSIRGGTILPQLAVVDPALCVSCPAQVTAASALDALTQGVESYISRNANNATRALAMQAVKLIDGAIEKVYDNGSDLAARSDMSEGTMLGALAFSVSGLGAVHGLAHPVGAVTHQGHGLICGVLLSKVLEWNLPVCRTELTDLANFCGYAAAEDFIERIKNLLVKFNISNKLSSYGLQAADLAWVVKNSRSGSMRANCREFSDAELTELLQEML